MINKKIENNIIETLDLSEIMQNALTYEIENCISSAHLITITKIIEEKLKSTLQDFDN